MGSDPSGVTVRRTLTRLRRALQGDLDRVRPLAASAARRDEIEELTSDLDRQLQRVSSAAVVTLVGATGAGKSTLLNALVGRDVAREGASRPTTRAPVVYRPRDADLGALLEGLPGAPPEVVDYDPGASGPWSEQILVDAPDINSVEALHRDVVRALAARSDALVVVAHRQSVSELASVAFVDDFAGRRDLVVVLNRADELTDEARGDLVGQLATLAAERWDAPDAPVVATSALAAKSDPRTPGWQELGSRLHELVRGGRLGRVRRHNAIGTAAALGRVFAEVRAEAGPEIARLERALEEGLAAWIAAVSEELDERLRLRRADLDHLIWSEAARRWDGPGGWVLRAGGVASLGLGAGAALARHHPWIAAGAALGGVAADRAREAWRARELESSSGLLPGPVELERLTREHLGSARLLAARLGGTPESLCTPTTEELAAGAEAGANEAWERLVRRDLPRAAAGTARWWLRLPVDLPVAALGGWVVWRSARGFLEGDYVGVDFFLNAALLLLAWLLATRVAVRSLLRARTRRLLLDARRRAAGALAEQARNVVERGTTRAREVEAALERLSDLGEGWRNELSVAATAGLGLPASGMPYSAGSPRGSSPEALP